MAYSPSLGKLGNQMKIKFAENLYKSGTKKVDFNSQFVAGMLATVKEVNGEAVITPVTDDADPVVGMFYCDRVDAFYSYVYKEIVDVVDGKFMTSKPNVKTGTIRVRTVGATPAECSETTDYAVDSLVNGVFSTVEGGSLEAATKVEVSYSYRDTEKSGFSSVEASGKVALIEGIGTLSTLVYDVTQDYVVGGKIYSNASGFLTSESGGQDLGTIVQAPTNSNPELIVKIKL